MAVPSTVPDFFQEETQYLLRSQVDWLVREVRVHDTFFARLLDTDEETFSSCRVREVALPPDGEATLRSRWQTVSQLISLLNFDPATVHDLFLRTITASPARNEIPLTPRWSGACLKTHIEQTRTAEIEEMDGWVSGLQVGDPHAAEAAGEKGMMCFVHPFDNDAVRRCGVKHVRAGDPNSPSPLLHCTLSPSPLCYEEPNGRGHEYVHGAAQRKSAVSALKGAQG